MGTKQVINVGKVWNKITNRLTSTLEGVGIMCVWWEYVRDLAQLCYLIIVLLSPVIC